MGKISKIKDNKMDMPKLILFLHGNINNKKMRFFLLLSQRQKDRGAKEMGQT